MLDINQCDCQLKETLCSFSHTPCKVGISYFVKYPILSPSGLQAGPGMRIASLCEGKAKPQPEQEGKGSARRGATVPDRRQVEAGTKSPE